MANIAGGTQYTRSRETGHQLTADEADFLKKYLLESPQTVISGNPSPKKNDRRSQDKRQ